MTLIDLIRRTPVAVRRRPSGVLDFDHTETIFKSAPGLWLNTSHYLLFNLHEQPQGGAAASEHAGAQSAERLLLPVANPAASLAVSVSSLHILTCYTRAKTFILKNESCDL